MTTRRNASEIAALFQDVNAARQGGKSVSQVCREHSISRTTFYRWHRRMSARTTDELATIWTFLADQRELRQTLADMGRELHVARLAAKQAPREERQQAAVWAQEQLGASRRLACRAVGISRSVREPQAAASDAPELVARLQELARIHVIYGYRRVWALLRREGFDVTTKQIYRLWRELRLKRACQPRQRWRTESPSPFQCQRVNESWSLDFLDHSLRDGRPAQVLSIIDDYSRECLALAVRRTMSAECVRMELSRLVDERGGAGQVRVDQGAACLLTESEGLLARADVRLVAVRGRSPAKNAIVESFHARLRAEFLDRQSFRTVAEFQQLADRWRDNYNNQRPHSSLGYATPAEFVLRRGSDPKAK
jgi:putative transposase